MNVDSLSYVRNLFGLDVHAAQAALREIAGFDVMTSQRYNALTSRRIAGPSRRRQTTGTTSRDISRLAGLPL